ncbi:hypothetical protein BVY03_01830 [bacterium K02(2017)]|nr:hypothetical protein BVY03_01830 [bacterium K02(2017)]
MQSLASSWKGALNRNPASIQPPHDSKDSSAVIPQPVSANNLDIDLFERKEANPIKLNIEPTTPIAHGLIVKPDYKISKLKLLKSISDTLPIEVIHGEGYVSDMIGQNVKGIEGIVTKIRGSSGFYIQTHHADSYARNGIFIYTKEKQEHIKPGDHIKIDGFVKSYQPDFAYRENLSATQIWMTKLKVLSQNNPIPQAITVHRDHFNIPDEVFTGFAPNGNIEQIGVPFNPKTDALAALKTLHGKLITINDPVVVGSSDGRGYFTAISQSFIPKDSLNSQGALIFDEQDQFYPGRFLVHSKKRLNIGDKITGPLTGVVNYDRGMFTIELIDDFELKTKELSFKTTNLTPSENHLRVASMNVEKLSTKDNTKKEKNKFWQIADTIVNRSLSPDILMLQEVLSDSGNNEDNKNHSQETLSILIQFIKDLGGPEYDFRYIRPINNKDGGKPGTNPRDAFLFRVDNKKRLKFVDTGSPGPRASSQTRVGSKKKLLGLTHSPGRVVPRSKHFKKSRKPLAGHFKFNGKNVYLVSHHLRSKKSDTPYLGRIQPPQVKSQAKQIEQVKVTRSLAENIIEQNPEALIIYGGDMNAYRGSATIQEFERDGLFFNADPLANGANVFADASYIYQGLAGSFDYLLHTAGLMAHGEPEFDILAENPTLELKHANRTSDHAVVMAKYYIPK